MKKLSFLLFAPFILAACGTKVSDDILPTSLGDSSSVSSTESSIVIKPSSPSSQVKSLEDFKPIKGNIVTLNTTKGDVVLKLYREKAPLTTLNFLTLVKDKFYDGIVFHRVIPGFMAQVGDPLTKEVGNEARWGTGGPGYTIKDEFDPTLTHDGPGVLSMANTNQPNTGGSQVFITYTAQPQLDGKHAVFGKVIAGMEVVKQLEVGDKIITATFK